MAMILTESHWCSLSKTDAVILFAHTAARANSRSSKYPRNIAKTMAKTRRQTGRMIKAINHVLDLIRLIMDKIFPVRACEVNKGGRLKTHQYPAKFSIVRHWFFAMIHVPCRGKLPAAGDERPSISCPCGREPAITTSNHNPVFRGMLRKIPGF